jgi:hypothetical protein
MREYTIKRVMVPPPLDGDFDGEAWSHAPPLDIDTFHEDGSDHRPVTQARALYDDCGLHVIFRVHDRYVRAAQVGYQTGVCRDSCVEFFVEPIAGRGYFNFEFNCGGSLLLHYNSRPERIAYDPVLVDERRLEQMKIYHSMPVKVDPEITEPTTWTLQFFAPFVLFEPYVGTIPPIAGSIWRGNYYKCGDLTSHPHWAMWNPIPGKLGFHKPEHFAPLIFER